MTDQPYIAYFGYGSLVNLDTLRTPYIDAFPARLKGWRRVWLERPPVPGSFAPQSGLAFLSVEPAEDCVLDGLLVLDHASSLPSLDEREALYERIELSDDKLELVHPNSHDLANTDNYVYVATEYPQADNVQILGSYLDVVLQGYKTHFGLEGLERFMATTNNFECAILDDRDAPFYPRPVAVSEDERRLFDSLLSTR